jgi:hypothetical protein
MSDDRNRLYVYEPVTAQSWVRELSRSNEAALVVESTGLMIASTALGLARGKSTALEPAQAPPKEPALEPLVVVERPHEGVSAPKERTATRAVRVVLGAEYVGGHFAPQPRWQSGIGGHIELLFTVGAFSRLSAGFLIPAARIEGPNTTIRRVPISWSAGYRFRRNQAVQPEMGGGPIVEVLWWDTAQSTGVRGTAGQTARLAIALGGGVGWRVVRGLGLHARARVEAWVINAELRAEVVGAANSTPTVLRFHPVTGALQVGLHYTF